MVVSEVVVSLRIFPGVLKSARVSAIEFSATDEVALRTVQPAGTLPASLGSDADLISEPSLKPSLSVSARFGLVPVSLASTKVPVLVSTESVSPSPSVSSLKGLVPVSVALTKIPVLVSEPSKMPSSSLSSFWGSVPARNSSRLLELSESGSPAESFTALSSPLASS